MFFISLSKIEACIKKALANKVFNPISDYTISNHINTFMSTHKWLEYKCNCINAQDEVVYRSRFPWGLQPKTSTRTPDKKKN